MLCFMMYCFGFTISAKKPYHFRNKIGLHDITSWLTEHLIYLSPGHFDQVPYPATKEGFTVISDSAVEVGFLRYENLSSLKFYSKRAFVEKTELERNQPAHVYFVKQKNRT